MKTRISLFLLLGGLMLLCTCKKDGDANTTSAPRTIFSSKFESQNDLNAWIQQAGGEAVIDSGAMKFQNITDCFMIETKDLIPVQTGRNYILKITGKYNRSVAGDPAYCVGNFMIGVVQQNTSLLFTGFGQFPDWTTQSFSFQSNSTAAIKIKFNIGTTRGAWIDNIELIEN